MEKHFTRQGSSVLVNGVEVARLPTIDLIKEVRSVTFLGLKEAKELVDVEVDNFVRNLNYRLQENMTDQARFDAALKASIAEGRPTSALHEMLAILPKGASVRTEFPRT